jgi:Bacterial tandem repeat domain 1
MAMAYSGVFRAGMGGHHLWVAEWPSFEAKWKELSNEGFRLISISANAEQGRPQFAGIFREGSGGHHLWVNT